MPTRRTTPDNLLAVTVRLPHATSHWIEETAEKEGVSRNHLCRQIFTDATTFYGLTENQTTLLRADAKAKGFDPDYPRKYIAQILSQYAIALEKKR